jgi:hypothetical protein
LGKKMPGPLGVRDSSETILVGLTGFEPATP